MKKHTALRIVLCVVLGVLLIYAGLSVWTVGFLVQLAGAGLLLRAWFLLLPLLPPRAEKVLRRITYAGLALLLISFIVIEGLIVANSRGTEDPDADVLIVLGAGLRGETPSLSLVYRLDAAQAYLERHPDAVAILTGGQGRLETITEAEAMRRYLLERGVDADRLLTEPEAHNTIENVRYARALIAQHGLDGRGVAVVSTSYHLYRAKRICARQGLEVQTVAAPVPRVQLTPLNSYLREYASVVLLYIKEVLGMGE